MTDCTYCIRDLPPWPISMARATHAIGCAHAYMTGSGRFGAPCPSIKDLGAAIPLSVRLHEQQMIWFDDSRWDLDA